VGVSNSVFRVMLSGSGLRTFAMPAAPGFRAPATQIACRWERRPRSYNSQQGMPETRCPRRNHVRKEFSQRQSSQPAELAWKATRLLGKHQAHIGWLDGGRSPRLESAQEATLSSVATPAFQRQCNSLASGR
jgi:hypothetical protein